MADTFLAEVLNFANVVLAGAIMVMVLRRFGRQHQFVIMGTLESAMLTAVSLYWTAVYIYISLDQPGSQQVCLWLGDCSPNWFGAIFIKPALTFTFAVMLSLTIRSEQRSRHQHIPKEKVQ